ncbi:Lysophospholipase L1 [Rathayibacter oskolensis]|uniref:Lysophospholipase L1 n=1 Tax=Rathayibacter oskolensis TaxID=1891671 RepID=A0A1X7MTS8_9MICO|nr:SGNH/GDSL hydrolase family protein [Rathayibacter oskolensis]SMH27738.1 Lysophospholipase L1 [Rathayibacter oskolensis]
MIRTTRARRVGVLAAVAIAAALLSGCTSSPAPEESAEPAAGALPFEAGVIVAMGDSISVGVAACGQNKPCPSASWTTGEDETVDSIARRAGEAVGAVPTVENFAFKGATSAELPREAEKAVAASPDLVTVLIGSNDVCRKRSSEITPPETFRASVTTALTTLSTGAPEATVFVSSIPNLLAFFEAERGDAEAIQRWGSSTSCNSLLYEPTSDSEEAVARRANVDTTIDAYNAILAEACAAVENCVYDGGALHDFEVGSGDISDVDHFHPSIEGQAKLADIAWTALLANAS